MRLSDVLHRKDPAHRPPVPRASESSGRRSKAASGPWPDRWRWIPDAWAWLRQLRYAKEFRIPAPGRVADRMHPMEQSPAEERSVEPPAESPADSAVESPATESIAPPASTSARIEQTAGAATTAEPQPGDAPAEREAGFPVPLLVQTGVNLWRVRRRMLEGNGRRVRDGLQRSFDELTAVLDAFSEAGLEIRDHTGEAVPDVGVLGLKAICFEPTEGITRHTVVETVKPSIFFRGELIQMGEVIIGVPIDEQEQSGE